MICAGSLGPFSQAELALQILQRVADAQAAVDPLGQPLQPLPLAHRHMSSAQCLPHIAQVRIPVQCSLLLLRQVDNGGRLLLSAQSIEALRKDPNVVPDERSSAPT